MRVSASRSASWMMRSGLFLGAADGFGGDPLAVGDPDRKSATRHDGDQGVEDAKSTTRVTSFPASRSGRYEPRTVSD